MMVPGSEGNPAAEADRSNAVVRPPIAFVATIVAALLAEQVIHLPLLAASSWARWLGVLLFGLGLAFAIWAIVTFRRAGTAIPTTQPTSIIVESGPYRFTRNPIYSGMLIALLGLSLTFGSAWLVIFVVPVYSVIRYGVVAFEEAYLERKFGEAYLNYKKRVRRWL